MIHYHGTPITPNAQLMRMSGRHFCVSYARPDQLHRCLNIGQSVMFDNGAYSAFTRAEAFDVNGYYEWLAPILSPPHFAVIPDVINGSLEDQQRLLTSWPRETFGLANASAVWHLNEPLSHLNFLCIAYQRVCLGSSGAYWHVGSPKWCSRMDETFNYLARQFSVMPYIHGLRMLGQLSGGWPFASADSTNVAQNHSRYGCAECLSDRIDAKQPFRRWKKRPIQEELL